MLLIFLPKVDRWKCSFCIITFLSKWCQQTKTPLPSRSMGNSVPLVVMLIVCVALLVFRIIAGRYHLLFIHVPRNVPDTYQALKNYLFYKCVSNKLSPHFHIRSISSLDYSHLKTKMARNLNFYSLCDGTSLKCFK